MCEAFVSLALTERTLMAVIVVTMSAVRKVFMKRIASVKF